MINERATVSHAIAGGDYGDRGVTANSVDVSVSDDDLRGVTISNATLTVDEGQSAQYTIVLESAPSSVVTIAVTPAGNDEVSVSPSSLQFTAANWNDEQTIRISSAHDADAVDDSATIQHSVSGGDYGEYGITAVSVNVAVRDDDIRGVRVTRDSISLREGGQGGYRIGLDTAPTGDVTISISVSGEADVRTSPESVTLTPSNWKTTQEVRVITEHDDDAANDQAMLEHSVSGGDYGLRGIKAKPVSVSITDDDERGVLISRRSLTVPEGGNGRYSVELETMPAGPVTIRLSSSGNGDISLSPQQLDLHARQLE